MPLVTLDRVSIAYGHLAPTAAGIERASHTLQPGGSWTTLRLVDIRQINS